MMRHDELMLFWAKLGAGEYPRDSHPVVCHLLDVANVAAELWEHSLNDGLQRWFAAPLGLSADQAGRWVSLWVGLHDLGKISPAFQRKVADAERTLTERCYRFPVPRPKDDLSHGFVSTVVLPELLERQYGLPRRVGNQVADAVGGHHGRFVDPESANRADRNRARLGDSRWDVARQVAAKTLAEALGILNAAELRMATLSPPWLLALAGLTTTADWIGSMTEFFPAASCSADWALYVTESRRRATRAVREIGWTGWRSPTESWSLHRLFDFIPPGNERPLQRAAAAIIPRLDGPTLVLIEAPMGEGKTEAAMLLADHWAAADRQRGCYFALPTMATSNQMFGRVRDFLRHRYPDDRVNLLLLHGRSSLSEALRELIRAGESWNAASVEDDEAERPNVVATEWFQFRKRGLLSPYGVGTIDQALLAVLQTKHVFVRLFGLANKTVIVDEVHAYDAYMSELLEHLLRWLKALGASVVLLSATLPQHRRQRLLQAWTGRDEIPVPAANYPRLSWVVGDRVEAAEFEAVKRVDVTLRHLSNDVDAWASELQSALAEGGCAAIVCNTVGRAQEIYLKLKSYFSAAELDLFHARFPFEEREAREQRTLGQFGKRDANGQDTMRCTRPRRVLVATQVIEQSLDIDFDLMISELAPIDLLFQRAGRLHRHSRFDDNGQPVDRERPQTLQSPQFWLSDPASRADGCPDWGPSRFVYAPHILLRTWFAVRGRGQFLLPADISPLVEEVYDDARACPDDLGQNWQRLWATSRDCLQARRDEATTIAAQKIIKPPTFKGSSLYHFTETPLEEDDPHVHQAFQALTRLAQPTVAIVCLFISPEGARLQPDAPVVDLESPPTPELIEAFIRRSVNLSHWPLVMELIARPRIPKGWRNVALLARHHAVLFDSRGVAVDMPHEVVLDPELGVRFGSVEDDDA